MATRTLDLPEAPRAQTAYRLAADCPCCGAPLVLRQNRQRATLFTGCSAYPSCTLPNHTTLASRPSQRRWSRCTPRPGARWHTPGPTRSGTWPQSGPRWTAPCGSSLPWPILTAGRTRRWHTNSPWPWWRCARRCSLARSVCRLRARSAPLVEDGRVTGTRGTGRAQRHRCQPRCPSGADREGKAPRLCECVAAPPGPRRRLAAHGDCHAADASTRIKALPTRAGENRTPRWANGYGAGHVTILPTGEAVGGAWREEGPYGPGAGVQVSCGGAPPAAWRRKEQTR